MTSAISAQDIYTVYPKQKQTIQPTMWGLFFEDINCSGDGGLYADYALDLIEYANGNVNTKWGVRRVALGHFDPFNLTYLGIGNENWGPQYYPLNKSSADE